MVPLTERSTDALISILALEVLRISDVRANDIAIELLSRFGTAPVRRLVLEACDRNNRPGHRIRALRALKRIGGELELSSFLDLNILLADKNPDIRAEAVDLMDTVRPGAGTAKSSEPRPVSEPTCPPPPQRRRRQGRLAPPMAGPVQAADIHDQQTQLRDPADSNGLEMGDPLGTLGQ